MKSAARHLVVLQHGSHGTPRDFRFLASLLAPTGAVVFQPTRPVKSATDGGTALWAETLADDLAAFIAANNLSSPLTLSCVGHSYGGVVLRHALVCGQRRHPAIFGDSVGRSPIRLGAFVSVASPHGGALLMKSPMMAKVGRFIGYVRSNTYRDLFLDTDLLTSELVDAPHLAVWAAFRRRVLIAAMNDRLVPLCSAALLPFDARRQPATELESLLASLPPASVAPLLPIGYGPLRFQSVRLDSGALASAVDAFPFLRERGIIRALTQRASCDAVLVDFSALQARGAGVPQKVRMGATVASHRALNCKEPFYLPDAFGQVSRLIANVLNE